MSSQVNLRQRLRKDLQDEDTSNERWSDDVLNRHLDAALDEVSLLAPLQSLSALTTEFASRQVDVSGLKPRLRIVAIEHPTGQYPPAYQPYTSWGDTITLDIITEPTGAEDVNVFWEGPHSITPDATFDPIMDEVILAGAAAYAALEWASKVSNQLNTGGDETWGRYMDFAAERQKTFHEKLAKLPAASRVRTAKMFTPSVTYARSMDTDPGP